MLIMKRIISILGICLCLLWRCGNTQRSGNDKVQNFMLTKDTTISNVDLVWIPKGVYKSGLNCQESAINYDFWMGVYEITNQQFYAFILDALRKNYLVKKENVVLYNYPGDSLVPENYYKVKIFDESIFLRNDSLLLNPEKGNHPVINVTWYGAMAFCKYYGFDLPYEKEWEKAARGNTCVWFPWGNQIDSSWANYFNSKDPFEPGTSPVGFYNGKTYKEFKTSNAIGAYGCYDMCGNAWEWVKDFVGTSIPYHIGKGGGFNYHTPAFLQVYYVSSFGPGIAPDLDMCNRTDGFRVVKRLNND